MVDDIETAAQYRQTLHRSTALRAQCAAIRLLQAQASADRSLGLIEPADLRDLAGLDDVLADIGHTLRGLDAALTDWETAESYGSADDPAADRAWHRRRS